VTARRLALSLVAALVAGACASDPPGAPPEPGFEPSVPARNATEAPLLPRYADALPAADPATFATLLEQLRGAPVVVNVWGSWCPPCRDEMPRLVRAHREHGDRIQFVGIDILDSRSEARTFIDEFGIEFPSVFDVDDAIKPSLGQFGQPVTIFYDRQGEQVRAWAGPISDERLRSYLRAIAS
jgi:cytochrome c biogenesis protein CcmG, thiol:disulfide interchange protein DsbE